ncbi:MAG TPA: hypothetical protein PLG34_08740 [Spirochaetota bacterium]|jgi:hypothetical protein|nr:MAG: hypothetical protein BWX91_02216 [Spirochaetes bacterium ADurb.Bin133]HNZ26698.1 hypothetical protein [Spirochaetota bacterium]HPY88053.1 hypothetical protein [Spirochaetota bacterium]HQB60184.1 hypothetical protein [Spirochaetota bacterium]
MKYDFSMVINKQMKSDIIQIGEYFNKKRVSSIISKVLQYLYPYIKNYHSFSSDYIPVYEKIQWNEKIHVKIDYKLYLLFKKIRDDTNGYSIAYIIRRMIEFFMHKIQSFENLDSFLVWLNSLNVKKNIEIKKKQYDVWKIMEEKQINKLGRLIMDGKKREFPLNAPYLSIVYNQFYRPILFKYLNL